MTNSNPPSGSPSPSRDKKSIIRAALALAAVTELEAMILVQEIFADAASLAQADRRHYYEPR